MYYSITYDEALNKAKDMAPTIDRSTEFLRWAEDMVELIAFIYQEDPDKTIEDLIDLLLKEDN
jgi:hypothetical protein